jgi:hypothetical protein
MVRIRTLVHCGELTKERPNRKAEKFTLIQVVRRLSLLGLIRHFRLPANITANYSFVKDFGSLPLDGCRGGLYESIKVCST